MGGCVLGETEQWATWLKGGSPWKGPLLALLLERPGHTNDLATRLIHRAGPAWRLDPNDASRVLQRAEELGLATSTYVQSKRTHRPVCRYEPTDLTAMAVDVWMNSPIPDEPFRPELWRRMVVARPEDVPALLDGLDHYERQLFELQQKQSTPFSVDTWVGLEKELNRTGVVMRVEAELTWIEHARALILQFRGLSDHDRG